jgi:hypothetical protein
MSDRSARLCTTAIGRVALYGTSAMENSTGNVETDPEDAPKASPRSFGLTFAFVSTLYALWPLWHAGSIRVWGLVAAAVLVGVAILRPRLLALPAQGWYAVGLALHTVVNPLVMGFLFYLVVTPFGIVQRWRTPEWSARFRPDPALTTYWIQKADIPTSMRRQF